MSCPTTVAAILASTTLLASFALADDQDTALRDQLDAILERIEALEAERSSGRWLTARRAEAVRGLVHEVLADAETRAALAGDGLTAGWDDRFFVRSADGRFELALQVQLQFKYAMSRRSGDAVDSTQGGFEYRRLRLKFGGHVIDPSWEYSITISGGRSDDVSDLSDGWVRKSFDGGWSLRAGQFKPPFLREELMGSTRQLAVDRSLVARNGAFNQGRTRGVELEWEGDRVRLQGMISNGFDRQNRALFERDTELAVTGRAEVLAAGDWGPFGDFAGWPDDAFGALLSVAVHYERDEYGTIDGPEESRVIWTADLSLEGRGANAFAAVMGQHAEADGRPDRDRLGVVVQGGLFATDRLEVFARYEWGDLDSPSVPDLHVLTVGFTRFFAGHDLKLTCDVGYGFSEVDPAWAVSSASWLGDAPGEDGQVVFRSQLQLLY